MVFGLALVVGFSLYFMQRPNWSEKTVVHNQVSTSSPQQQNSTLLPTSDWNAPEKNMVLLAENLPPCNGNSLFTAPIAADDTFDSITPLGNISTYKGVTGHVFPVDHMYVGFKHTTPGDLKSPSLPATILAPADMEIFKIEHTTYEQNGQKVGEDYTIHMASCREVTVNLGHINHLSQTIQNAIDGQDKKYCKKPFTTGGTGSPVFNSCSYSLLLNVKAGDGIATAGGPGVTNTSSFDYGVYDMRIRPLSFIGNYWNPMNLHAVCGLYYYADGDVKTSLLKKLNNTKKDANGLPDCGTNMWDKPSTAQGNWVLPDTRRGNVPDDRGMAAVHRNTDSDTSGVLTWGGTIATADKLSFKFRPSGQINRDPGSITADGQIYCFEDTSFNLAKSIKMQLVDDLTLKVEYADTVCPPQLTFRNPTVYNR